MSGLNERQKRHLRRLGHDRKPVVRTGNAGLTDAVIAELDVALRDHELVKLKLVANDRQQRRRYTEELLASTGAQLVQSIGHTILVYRPNPDKRNPIALPA